MPRVVRIYNTGGPEVLKIEDINAPEPGSGEVSIAVKAFGLNRAEALFRSGKHFETGSFPARLGYEASGTVLGVGPGVHEFCVGDAVSVIPPPSITRWGSYGEVAAFPADHVVRHPQHMSWIDAAATWMPLVTAYGALIEIAALSEGDFVLIGAAASSVGLAAIQLARSVGAIAIATTRSARKKEALLAHGAHHVLLHDSEELGAQLRRITGGAGVRVALDPVAGSHLQKCIEALAPRGQLILYGSLGGDPASLPVSAMIAKGVQVRGYSFREIVADPARRARARQCVIAGLEAKRFRPIVDRVFTLDEIVQAHAYLETGAQFGKIVITT